MATRKKRSITELDKIFIRLYSERGLPFESYSVGQRGGGIISGNGYRYNYRENPDLGTLVIYGGRTAGKRNCFLLLIDKDIATLQSVERGDDCSLDKGASSTNMVHAAFALAKEKGASQLNLTDTSTKHMINGKSFRISEMYFLATGRTWYETITDVKPIPSEAKTVDGWRTRVRTNRWRDVFKCLQNIYPDIVVPVNISDIVIDAEGSAMIVFQRIKTAKTDFFADYGLNLSVCCGVGPLDRIIWSCTL